MARRLVLLALALAAVTSGCDRVQELARLENNRSRIVGDWRRVVMSLPGDEIYRFANGVILRDGIETGAYDFVANHRVQVTLDGPPTTYWVDFSDGGATMTWSRDTPAGRQVAVTWKR